MESQKDTFKKELERNNKKSIRKLMEQRKTIARKQEEINKLKTK